MCHYITHSHHVAGLTKCHSFGDCMVTTVMADGKVLLFERIQSKRCVKQWTSFGKMRVRTITLNDNISAKPPIIPCNGTKKKTAPKHHYNEAVRRRLRFGAAPACANCNPTSKEWLFTTCNSPLLVRCSLFVDRPRKVCRTSTLKRLCCFQEPFIVTTHFKLYGTTGIKCSWPHSTTTNVSNTIL